MNQVKKVSGMLLLLATIAIIIIIFYNNQDVSSYNSDVDKPSKIKDAKKEITLQYRQIEPTHQIKKIGFNNELEKALELPPDNGRKEFIKKTIETINKDKLIEILDIYTSIQDERDPKRTITGTILSEISSDNGLNLFFDELSSYKNNEEVLANFVSSTIYNNTLNSFDKLMEVADIPASLELQQRVSQGILMTYQGSIDIQRFANANAWADQKNYFSINQENILTGLLQEAPTDVINNFYSKNKFKFSNSGLVKLEEIIKSKALMEESAK